LGGKLYSDHADCREALSKYNSAKLDRNVNDSTKWNSTKWKHQWLLDYTRQNRESCLHAEETHIEWL